MNERFDAFFREEVLSKIRPIGPWKDYPVGTKAFAIDGGHWTKTERGWKWMEHGSTFPTPGANVGWVILP